MLSIRKAVTVVVIAGTSIIGLGASPASASCIGFETNDDKLYESGNTKVYYPPLPNDVTPRDCLDADQDVPVVVEF